jgi:hypothetical protein
MSIRKCYTYHHHHHHHHHLIPGFGFPICSIVKGQQFTHLSLKQLKFRWPPDPYFRSIRGDSKGKVKTLAGDSIGHREKKVDMNMCLIPNIYRDTPDRMCKYKTIMDGNKDRKITYC